jgi:hypothetical protein
MADQRIPDETVASTLTSAGNDTMSPASNRVQGDTFTVSYRFEPASPVIGDHFNVIGRVCRNDGVEFRGTVKADASMPLHGHGMNYLPATQMLDGGQFVASGLLLHMPGQWLVEVRVADGARRERLRFEYQAKR